MTALDENTKEMIEAEEEDPDVQDRRHLRISGERVENAAQAKALAKSPAALQEPQIHLGLDLHGGHGAPGCGITVDMVDFGTYSGKLMVDRSTHSLSRGGYTTGADLVKAKQ